MEENQYLTNTRTLKLDISSNSEFNFYNAGKRHYIINTMHQLITESDKETAGGTQQAKQHL